MSMSIFELLSVSLASNLARPVHWPVRESGETGSGGPDAGELDGRIAAQPIDVVAVLVARAIAHHATSDGLAPTTKSRNTSIA